MATKSSSAKRPTPKTAASSRPSKSGVSTTKARQAYRWTDGGNAKRLVDMYGEDMRWTDAWGWMVWDGTTWVHDYNAKLGTQRALNVCEAIREDARRLASTKKDEDKDAADQLSKWANRSENIGKVKGMLGLAMADDRVHMAAEEFDKDPRRLNTKNKSLYLGNDGVEVGDHEREHYARQITETVYDPKAECPRFRRLLEQSLPDPEVREALQLLMGYSLLGRNPARQIVFLMGETTSGKSTILTAVSKVLGPHYAGPFGLNVFRGSGNAGGPRADIVAILTKRFVTTVEANSEVKLHADSLKQLSGNDPVSARGTYEKAPVECVPAFTAWIATNGAPTVEHADAALWKRLVAIQFEGRRSWNEQDNDLGDKLAAEASGILNWLLAGWNAYAAAGERFPEAWPDEIVEATDQLRHDLSDLDTFIAEMCVADPALQAGSRYRLNREYCVLFEHLWNAYDVWSVNNRTAERDVLTQNRFARELTARGFASRSMHVTSGDSSPKHRIGLRLRSSRRVS